MTFRELPSVLRRLLMCVALLATFIASKCVRAQASEADIAARLKDKPLFLRGFWGEDDLKFNGTGQPLGTYGHVSFTESGIRVNGVRLRGDRLIVSGTRIGIAFDKAGHARRIPMAWNTYSGDISIEIQGQAGQDFGPALDAIFVEDLTGLVPLLPSYWRDYAQTHFVARAAAAPADTPSREVGNQQAAGVNASGAATSDPSQLPKHDNVSPPRLLKQADPTFSAEARGLHYSSAVEVYFWVDEKGLPSHLRIVRPAGMGLDERALAAVTTYRFAPATMNGQPVKVDLYVDVNFKIF